MYIVDHEEEICSLMKSRDVAQAKLDALEPGSDGYGDALKAVTELSKAIDISQKRFIESKMSEKKLELEAKRIKAEQVENKRQFEESMNRRKKEFIIETGLGVAGGVAKGAMVAGFQAQEFNGSTLLTTKKAQEFTRDFLHFGRKR